jgi:amino acid permease
LFVFAGAFDYANKATAVAGFMSYWTQDKVPDAVWIVFALLIPIVLNLLNVRKNGEYEYWTSMTKVTMLIILTITGILLALGAVPGLRYLLATDGKNKPVSCELNAGLSCLENPGFNCSFRILGLRLISRLARNAMEILHC